ncbi:MAG2-interacting protein 2 isoform X2 [Aegilops tauschii subsp. strangulata]|nr:MAG2-interacting protein 2-like isoform X2 [Triticum aestivum]
MGAEVDALYEIGRHATGSHEIPCERDETARASGGSSGEGGGVLSYLSFQGVSKLRERWSRYNTLGGSKRRKRENAASLFVSRNAEYVAVAVGNRIYILRKSDGYESPCGIYTNCYKFSEPDNSGDGSAWDSRIIRLRLLWYNDLLETFLGIIMGR